MSICSVLYLWEDKKRPGEVKFGDHIIEFDTPLTQEEIELNTKSYIRRELKRLKYLFDSGDIVVHWCIDATDYARSVGKNYPHAKLDTFIANEKTDLKLFRISKQGGDFYKISSDELTSKVNSVVYGSSNVATFKPHKYQQEAIDKSVQYFKNGGTDFLLDAVMRFGKCFTSYKIANELECKKILVITGRPKVKSGWKDDLNHIDFNNWDFIDSQNRSNVDFYKENPLLLQEPPNAEVIFASFQGGKKDDSRIQNIIDQEIDMTIIDEAHSYFSADALDFVRYKLNSKRRLWVSGTPFKAYESGMFDGETDAYRFTLLNLLKEKKRVEQALKSGELVSSSDLRYLEFPDVQFLVAEYPNFDVNSLYDEQNLNMKALLSSKGDVSNYPDEVNELLSSLFRTDARSPFNLSGREIKYPVNAKHVWMAVPAGKDDNGTLPVAAATTLETAIRKHSSMSEKFDPIAIKGDKDQDDVNRHITLAKQNNKGSINISCRSLNTGTKFPDINTVVFLNETSSASEFWQTIGRALQPMKGKESITVICYSIEMVVNMANKMVEYSVQKDQSHNQIMSEFLTMMPVYASNGPRIRAMNIEDVYTELSTKGSVLKSFGDREIIGKDFEDIVLNNLEFFQNIPDVSSNEEPKVTNLYGGGLKGKNSIQKRSNPTTREEKGVVDEAKAKVREFLKLTGSVMAASLLYDEYLVKSSQDLKDIKEETIDGELYPGTKQVLLGLLETGAINVPILDKKISAFYNVELKSRVVE